MLEKLAPTLLAGMPAIVKPASVGAYLTHAAFRILIDSGVIPAGSLQLLLGRPGELIDQLDGQDVLAFTGSAQTAALLKASSSVVTRAVRFTAEQDSLNAAVLGPDASPDSPEFQLFIKEVVREMTQKAGQKCTAIRRALVPSALIDQVQDAITAMLARTTIGNPRTEGVRMGALAGLRQREDVRANLDLLKRDATVAFGGNSPQLVDADADRGAFVMPTLLRCDTPHESESVHAIEAFGPVSTLMPYEDIADAAAITRAGLGSLVCSLFSADANAVGEFVLATASSHGRMLVIDRDSAPNSTGHGAAMPQLVHGGPGRAGGGEELGGLFGMGHYMQRTAIQASAERLEAIASL
jgi:oxepin-CoA hydrolase/3-oxo-5,6-dehydrosuberyl-CoA semialdehyde dehydrogenase